ncbi:MAG: tRNA (adenosine(37)-N6)-dimethylallyltransferase MiaA [Caldilineaceae bacterium]|nr:tRNA (adenosine(37)-N6)-dimethylallyltransferase MiaA [Caldilineaceae bacterium]
MPWPICEGKRTFCSFVSQPLLALAEQTLPPLVTILGPTGVGKTALSLRLCERFDGEIISADSRQIYRGMDIGTAKVTADEQARVPHHLIDIRAPDEVLTVAEYQRLAYAAIDAIHSRKRVPFLVGGTALYVRAVIEGLRIPAVKPDPALRAQLEAELATDGVGSLFARLQKLDPETARAIDARNPRRVLRALEIYLLTGKSKVELEGREPPPYRMLAIGLTRARPALYALIDARVEKMVKAGLSQETERLLAAGYAPTLPAMTSLGYREMIAYLQHQLTLDEAVERIKLETHRYVRHQFTWFRKLPSIQWFDLGETSSAEIENTIGTWLAAAQDSPTTA